MLVKNDRRLTAVKIGVVGTGYVGAVQGAILAHLGHEVVSLDIDTDKIKLLRQGISPIYEPGLSELIQQGISNKRLVYTTDYDALSDERVEVIFLCLPTPPNEDGSADLRYILSAAKSITEVMKSDTVLVNKSTVPAGSAEKVASHIKSAIRDGVTIHIASNPEFLREGTAVKDFLEPDSIIIGTDSKHALTILRKVYASFEPGILFETDIRTAELIKYGRNGFRALKISFINNLAEVASELMADIDDLVRAMSMDPVVGSYFINPGPGWGGSCFPKDTRALLATSESVGVRFGQLRETLIDNERHKKRVFTQVQDHYSGKLTNKQFAVWGAAFKANTDDIRESPAIDIINELLKAGSKVVVYDPKAMENVKKLYQGNSSIIFADSLYMTVKNSNGIIIATEWPEFSSTDFKELGKNMKDKVVFDARNIFNIKDMTNESSVNEMIKNGFVYKSFGRRTLSPNA